MISQGRGVAAISRRRRFVIENAGDASYPEGWENYQTVMSYDRDDWLRVDSTTYADGKLSWELTPERDSVWFAYFAPYSWERHERVVAELSGPGALGAHSVIGETLEGRPLDMLTFGDGPLQIWATARQHPGESMAEWCAEGLSRFLNDADEPLARKLRSVATVRVINNMNPACAPRVFYLVAAAPPRPARPTRVKTSPHRTARSRDISASTRPAPT